MNPIYKILGLDCSHWQNKPDWTKAKAQGIKFVIVKAGEVNRDGSLFYDDKHDRNIAALKATGIPCGDYYYFHPSKGASKQANHWASIWKKNPPNLPPVIDVEDNDGYLPKDVCKQLFAFIDAVEDKIGIAPIIYSTNSFLVSKVGNPNWKPETKFWIARYNTTIKDLSIKIKDNVIMWQFTDRLKLPGLPLMDGNYWIKSEAEFNQFTGVPPVGHDPIEIARIKLGIFPFRRNIERMLDNIKG